MKNIIAIITLAASIGTAHASVVEFNGNPSTSWADGTFSSYLPAGLGNADGFFALSSYEAFNGYGVSGESINFSQPVFFNSFSIMPYVGHVYWYATTIISEYDVNNILIGQQSDNPNATDFTTFNVALANVSKIVFTHSSQYYNGSIPNASWFLVNDVTYNEPVSVPEPSSIALLALGLLSFVVARKKA